MRKKIAFQLQHQCQETHPANSMMLLLDNPFKPVDILKKLKYDSKVLEF